MAAAPTSHMIKAVIQYFSPGSAAIYSRKRPGVPVTQWHFGYKDFGLILSDRLVNFQGNDIRSGLVATVELERQSLDEALLDSRSIAETAITLTSLCSGTNSHPCRIIGYVDLTSQKMKSYVYPLDNSPQFGPVNVLKQEEFRPIFNAFERSSEKQRIARALAYLRKGANETEVVDEFVAYYLGLETLKCILAKRQRGPGIKAKNWAGVDAIFGALGEIQFKDVNLTRNDLIHSKQSLDDAFVKKVTSYTKPMRRALIQALSEILGLDSELAETLRLKPLVRQRMPPWITLESHFETGEDLIGDELVTFFPRIEGHVTAIRSSIGEEGELTMSYDITHTFFGPDGVKPVGEVEVEQWGDLDAGIRNARIHVRS